MFTVHFADGFNYIYIHFFEVDETSESYSTQDSNVLSLYQPFEFWFEEPHLHAIPVLKDLEFLGLSSVVTMYISFHYISSFITS